MGNWVGMGSGGGGVGGPTVTPLTPLPVRLVEPSLPPSGAFRVGGDQGAPLPVCKFFQRSPHMGDGVSGLRPNFFQGLPPRGEIVRVWGNPQQLPAPGRLTSWRINLNDPRVCGVGGCCLKF